MDNIKRANWLELLFDLIFVYAVSKATHILLHAHHGHIEIAQYITFLLVMIPIWWAWTGHTLFATRFDTEDIWQRLLTLAQMLAVVFWTTFISADFDPNYHGYLIFYVVIRLLLVFMYWRVAWADSIARPITKNLSIGFIAGMLVSLSSLLFEPPLRYIVLYMGIGIEIITPLLSRHVLKKIPVKSHHLPERYGLLTIILIGESVILLATSLSEVQWSVSNITAASAGFILISAIWWLYFDLMDQRLIGKQLNTGQHIIYGHLFIYAGLSAIAVFIRFAIKPELDLVSHLVLFLTAFLTLSGGLVIVFSFKTIINKMQFFKFAIIFIAFIVSLIFSADMR